MPMHSYFLRLLFLLVVNADILSIVETTKYCGQANSKVCPLTFILDSNTTLSLSSTWLSSIQSVSSDLGTCTLNGNTLTLAPPASSTKFAISCIFYLNDNVAVFSASDVAISSSSSAQYDLSFPYISYVTQEFEVTTVDSICGDFNDSSNCALTIAIPTTPSSFNFVTSSKFVSIRCSSGISISSTPSTSSGDSRLYVYAVDSSTALNDGITTGTCALTVQKSPLSPYFFASLNDNPDDAIWEYRGVLYLEPTFSVELYDGDCLVNDTNLCTLIYSYEETSTSILTATDFSDLRADTGFEHSFGDISTCSDAIIASVSTTENRQVLCQRWSKYLARTSVSINSTYPTTIALHGHAFYGKTVPFPSILPTYVTPLNILPLDDCDDDSYTTCTLSYRATHFGQGLTLVLNHLPYNANVQSYSCTEESSFDTFYRKITIGSSSSSLSPTTLYSQWCNVSYALQPINGNSTTLAPVDLNPNTQFTISLYRYGNDTSINDITWSYTPPIPSYASLPMTFSTEEICSDDVSQNCTYNIIFPPLQDSSGNVLTNNTPRNFAIALPAQQRIISSWWSSITYSNVISSVTPTIESLEKTSLDITEINHAGTIDYNTEDTTDLTVYYLLHYISFVSTISFDWDELYSDPTQPLVLSVLYRKTALGEDYFNGTAFIAQWNGIFLSNPWYDPTERIIVFRPPLLPHWGDNCNVITERFCSLTVDVTPEWNAMTLTLLNGYVSSFIGDCFTWILLSATTHRLVFDNSRPNCTINLHKYYMTNNYVTDATHLGTNNSPTKEFNIYYDYYNRYTDYKTANLTNYDSTLTITPAYYWVNPIRWYLEGPLTFDLCDDPTSPICYVNVTIYNSFWPFDVYLAQGGGIYDRVVMRADMPPTSAISTAELAPDSPCGLNSSNLTAPYFFVNRTGTQMWMSSLPGPEQDSSQAYSFGGGAEPVVCEIWLSKTTYNQAPMIGKQFQIRQVGTVYDITAYTSTYPNIVYNPIALQPFDNCWTAYTSDTSLCTFKVTLSASSDFPLYAFRAVLNDSNTIPFFTNGATNCYDTQAQAEAVALDSSVASTIDSYDIVAEFDMVLPTEDDSQGSWTIFSKRFVPATQTVYCYISYGYQSNYVTGTGSVSTRRPIYLSRYVSNTDYQASAAIDFEDTEHANSTFVLDSVLYGSFAQPSIQSLSYSTSTNMTIKWNFLIANILYLDIATRWGPSDYSYDCYDVNDETNIIATLHNRFSASRLTILAPDLLQAGDACTFTFEFTLQYPTESVNIEHNAVINVTTVDSGQNVTQSSHSFYAVYNYPVYVNSATVTSA